MKSLFPKLNFWFLSFFVTLLANGELKDLGNFSALTATDRSKFIVLSQTVLAQARNSSSVIVYGRVNCPLTQNLIKELQKRKITYLFKSVDLTATDQEMEQLAFENNVNIPSKYRLPAVGINDKIFFSSSGIKINQVLSELGRSPIISQNFEVAPEN